MTLKEHQNGYLLILFFTLIIFACLPIWYFPFYINQDGSPHLYNSYLLLEILRGNDIFTNIYSINPYPIPNLSGHWILAFLLLFFTPNIASKIIITLTFAGFVAACGWLRRQTAGVEGIEISFLFGAALAFNWLWFLGFYNFILGLTGYTFALGLFWKWRENLNFPKAAILALTFIFVYFSHLISFGMLFGSVGLIALSSVTKNRKSNYFWTFVSFLPAIPLLIGYKISTESGGTITPVWRYLKNPFSISDWILQLQVADPFQLISRRAFPFLHTESAFFAVFSVFLWIFVLVVLLIAGTWIFQNKVKFNLKENFPWLILLTLSFLFWIFFPDDFGKSHGGFLRERVLLCGLVCFIPIYRVGRIRHLKIISYILLAGIIIFQTAVLWEYSINANKIARTYLSAKSSISDEDKLASVVFVEGGGCRYKANPLSNLNPLLGIGKNTKIWDNYELGYYIFPVIAKNPDEQRFIYEFREANIVEICNSNENVSKKLEDLKRLLNFNHQKITVLLIWNEDERIKPIISEWFEVEPFFHNDKVKLYRHK